MYASVSAVEDQNKQIVDAVVPHLSAPWLAGLPVDAHLLPGALTSVSVAVIFL